ncbi:similar to Saccharomyces cerevisiae YPL022W RAD1 Single-stranded DNA endonuclease (with Rad10p) [Maudiozyma saulgeensis]|uniref:Similar to Saccharomyces cerevisiae YPL022W RAD1 Single-stranded DNA endonuclease (With Rad10p) n=1 Tax=Maudiozyma saulgeensis TaxID=1789683 RepID=A0A1X7RAW5_9SACH|nr:similar to Saccharomyces cerevisiae YPL022W RAD1 Single-stranded DNA endonuclease (with Rad10p) [Kazachstania saulgeensis]
MAGLFVQDEDLEDEFLQQELSRQDEIITSKVRDSSHQVTDDNDIMTSSTQEAISNEKVDDISEDEEDEKSLYPLIPVDADQGNDMKPNIEDIRPVDIKLNVELPFQVQIIESCLVSDDPLVILGKGLDVTNIVANLLHILATPTMVNGESKRSLVIVLNATASDNRRLYQGLQEFAWLDDRQEAEQEQNFQTPFHIVTSDSLSVEKRRKLYLGGGIVSVTSRILIVDLLSGILHPNKVTGMVILNVDSLKNYSNESFILEIYRSQNRWGFIKGFSEVPESFTMEFSPLTKRMKELRFKNVLLWPRFRVEISSVLNKNSDLNKVIEVKVSLTNSMSQIQFGLMECLKKCIDELNRKNPTLSLEWWNSENSLDPNFLKSINSVMMPNWHRISYESKQLIKDIRFLKHLHKSLLNADAVDFYEDVQTSLDANKPSVSRKYTESPWLMAEESQLVISYARKRVYDKEEYSLEELPKWEQLMNILDDIAQSRLKNNQSGPTLIVCSDSNTAIQLSRLVKMGNVKQGLRKLMLSKLQYYKERREERKRLLNEVKEKHNQPTELDVSTTFSKEQVESKRRRTRGAAVVAQVQRLKTAGSGEDIESAIDSYDLHNELGLINDEDEDENVSDIDLLEGHPLDNQGNDIITQMENIPDDLETIDENQDFELQQILTEGYNNITHETFEKQLDDISFVDTSDQVIIETFSDVDDETLLQEIRPSFIVMFQPDLTFIRRVEIYRTIQNQDLKIYFMYYAESIEEQQHLTSIKREKDAFSKLIKENSQLASHFEAPEDISHFKNLAERQMKMNKLNNKNTRNAGGQNNSAHFTQDVVIVDTREFNASLPGLLFRYGVRVIPAMLSVGDYIITPDISLERKSISDLIGSLQNNRLVGQCKKMLKYYKYAVLLIEFDENQSFSLEPFSERKNYRKSDLSTTHPISSKLSQDEIQSKLAKLIIKFPTLKIIWSSSPLQTINIILELKIGRDQPDPNVAISFGIHLRKNAKVNNSQSTKDKENTDKFSGLLGIDGLSKIDYFNIRKKVKQYNKLAKMNIDQLTEISGDSTIAYKILDFIQEQKELEKDIDIDEM